MAKLRSPNCPQIPFTEAAEKARKVYDTEHTHPADKKVIAEDLGYTSISGASLSLIGALRQYGLLEGSGLGLRISDDAVAYFELPGDSPERSSALKRMLYRPPLFAELHKQFGNRPPSEGNLRHSLIKRGFIPKSADEVLRVYRENSKLDSEDNEEYNEPEENMESTTQNSADASKASALKVAMTRAYAFDISIPREVKGELKIVGQFGKEDLDRLRKALNGQLAMIEAALED